MTLQHHIADTVAEKLRLWPIAGPVDADGVAQGIKNPLHYGLPQRLKKARKAAKIGVSVVAVRAGLSKDTARRIEADGGAPHLDVVEALASVLQISPGNLAYGIGQETAQRAPGGAEGVGVRLRQLREHSGLAVRALARAAGCSDTAIRAIEEGRVSPGVDTAEALADSLGVSPAWLAFGEE